MNTNKADKVSSATAGDIASLDANGNLVDSGVVASYVIRRTNISTSADCNDLIDVFTEYRVGDTVANRPTTDSTAYILRTFRSGTSSTTYSQIAYRIGGVAIYRRYCNSSGVWSSWEKLVTESDLTSSVTSGSTAPITSGGVYANVLLNTTPLAESTNLNSCISETHIHVWNTGNTNRVTSLINKPTGVLGGECAVIYIPMGTPHGQQFYIDSAGSNWGIYTRHRNDNNNWGSWTKLH